VANRPALVAALEERLRTDTALAWEQRLAAVGAPAGLVGDVGSAISRAQEYGLAPVVEPGAGRVPQIAHTVRYVNTHPAPATPPPALGEHTAAVLRWLDGDPATAFSPA
jgi:formyl-CoA transferase